MNIFRSLWPLNIIELPGGVSLGKLGVTPIRSPRGEAPSQFEGKSGTHMERPLDDNNADRSSVRVQKRPRTMVPKITPVRNFFNREKYEGVPQKRQNGEV